MVPNHLEKRAEQYQDIVSKFADKFHIDKRLIFAVIHTESSFNPMARSAPAFGLMQLVPRFGAKEAYRFLYKKDQKITSTYLYDPENNIMLGGAYLHKFL